MFDVNSIRELAADWLGDVGDAALARLNDLVRVVRGGEVEFERDGSSAWNRCASCAELVDADDVVDGSEVRCAGCGLRHVVTEYQDGSFGLSPFGSEDEENDEPAPPSDRATPPDASAAAKVPESPTGGAGPAWRGIEHTVHETRVRSGAWIVGPDSGPVMIATFSGPRAEERAREYAVWVSAPLPCSPVLLSGQDRAADNGPWCDRHGGRFASTPAAPEPPMASDGFDGFPSDIPPEIDAQAAEIAAIVDERVSKVLERRRTRITAGMTRVIVAATEENLMPHETAYRVLRWLEHVHGYAQSGTPAAPAQDGSSAHQGPPLEALRGLVTSWSRLAMERHAAAEGSETNSYIGGHYRGLSRAYGHAVADLCRVAGIEPPPPPEGPRGAPGQEAQDGPSCRFTIDGWNLVASEGKRLETMPQGDAAASQDAPATPSRAPAAVAPPRNRVESLMCAWADRLAASGLVELAEHVRAEVTDPDEKPLDVVAAREIIERTGETPEAASSILASPETPDPRWELGAVWEHRAGGAIGVTRHTIRSAGVRHVVFDGGRGELLADMTDANGWRFVPAKPAQVKPGQVWRCVGVDGELEAWRARNDGGVTLYQKGARVMVARSADMLGLKEWTFVRGPR